MKNILVAIIVVLSISPAYAEGGRGHGGGWERGGGGWGWGGWIAPALIGGAIAYDLTYPRTVYTQPYPVYEQPYPVYVQPAPVYAQPAPVYAPGAAPSAGQFWYFCAAANAYYPYVTSCTNGWQAVPTTPPGYLPGASYRAPGQ